MATPEDDPGVDANAPIWVAPVQDVGFAFGVSQVFVCDGGGTGVSRAILASTFTVRERNT